MTDEVTLIEAGSISIEINSQAVEPKDYFKILKGKIQNTTDTALKAQLDVIGEQLIAANKIGQKTFLEKLAFTWDVLVKEQVLFSLGIDKYVYKDDIKHFLDNVKPENSIKIIELERYPRAIPLDVLKKIDEIKSKNIFDDFCVVFTDFTEQTYETEEEKVLVARNRDPIVFGFFKHEHTGLKHDRFYFIVDWEDEHCDLTFTKMIEKMSVMGMDRAEKTISNDVNYLQEIVNNTLASMKKQNQNFIPQTARSKETSKSWFKRLFGK